MKRTLELKVGAFVFVGLILGGISIFLLGGERSLLKSHYNLYTEFEQVQGLVKGSVISLAGVPVGNVSNISFYPQHNKLRVTLRIDQQFEDRIREGTTAEIRTQGALGDKFIYLNPGPPNRDVLAAETDIQAQEGGDLLSVISSKGDAVQHAFDVITEVHKLMTAINGNGRSQKVMENLAESTTAIRSTLIMLNQMMLQVQGQGDDKSDLQKSVKHLASILRKIDQGEGTLGALINDPTLHENLKAMLGGSPRQRYLKGLARDAIQNSEEKKK